MLVPGTTDLGTRIGGSSAGLQTVMLRNTGATDATFTSIGFTGADAADFAVTVTPGDPSACASLTPVMTAGTSCTLTVSAQPALIGLTSKSANLSFITSNGSSQDIPYSMNVSYSMLLGTVTDQTTGLPISGATVALGGSAQSVVTDSTGTFKFGPLLDGTYSITASLTGYLDNTVNTIAVSTSQSGIAPVSLTPGYILTAYVAGTGTGTVTSDPGGISCAGNGTGTAVTCPYGFSGSVALHATVTGTSMFGGWGGLHCSGLASTCTVTMSGPTDVTATFNQAPLVSIGGKEYLSLQAAYDAAVDNDIIQLLQNTVTGTLNANRIVSVTIEGGYSGFSDAPGVTTVKAPLVISKGRAALQRIVIKK
ncbi:MAG: carboxypeptidase regulatory-like domain-containing protein [Desulfuromonadaceae bacterium]